MTQIFQGFDALEKLDELAEQVSTEQEPQVLTTAVIDDVEEGVEEDAPILTEPPNGYRFAALREKHLLKFFEYYDLEEKDRSDWHLYNRALNAAGLAGFFEEPPQMRVKDVFTVTDEEKDRIMRTVGELMPDITRTLFNSLFSHIREATHTPKN